MIVYNAIKCRHCFDVIESIHRHDFVTCKCGKVSVDGGTVYLRRSYDKPTDYVELALEDDQPYEIVRKFAYRLGYGKPGSPDYGVFRKTTFDKMSDEHLQASLDYHGVAKGGDHWCLLLKEKLYRAEMEDSVG